MWYDQNSISPVLPTALTLIRYDIFCREWMRRFEHLPLCGSGPQVQIPSDDTFEGRQCHDLLRMRPHLHKHIHFKATEAEMLQTRGLLECNVEPLIRAAHEVYSSLVVYLRQWALSSNL